MGKALRSCLGFLSILLCALCLALTTASVVYVDDWQEYQVTPSDSRFAFQRMMTVDGSTFWTDANTQLSHSGNVSVTSLGLQINSAPGFGSGAFALKGRISLSCWLMGYDGVYSFTRCYGYLFHPDGSADYFTFTASPSSSGGGYWVDMDFDIRSTKTVTGVAFWMELPDDFEPSGYVFNGVDDSTSSNLVVGYGSSLSPTFPGSGLSVSDMPHDTVSAMNEAESIIHDGTTYDFDRANSMIGGLPDKLDYFGQPLAFVRNFTNNLIENLPWLDTVLSVSLALGIIALLLNLSAWIGRASKK